MSEHLKPPTLKDFKTQWHHVMTGLGLLASGAALIACMNPEKPQLINNGITELDQVANAGDKVLLGKFHSVTTFHDGKKNTLTFTAMAANRCAFDFKSSYKGKTASSDPIIVFNDNLTVIKDGEGDLEFIASCDGEYNKGSVSVEINHP